MSTTRTSSSTLKIALARSLIIGTSQRGGSTGGTMVAVVAVASCLTTTIPLKHVPRLAGRRTTTRDQLLLLLLRQRSRGSWILFVQVVVLGGGSHRCGRGSSKIWTTTRKGRRKLRLEIQLLLLLLLLIELGGNRRLVLLLVCGCGSRCSSLRQGRGTSTGTFAGAASTRVGRSRILMQLNVHDGCG